MSLWSFPYADTINEPLVDAWWIPGFTSQAPGYIYAANPLLANGPGFPAGLDYVVINGSYYDTSGNPLSGYLTFWPSAPLIFNVNGAYTYMPQRYAGLNFSLIGVNQMGDGKIYLQYGRLYVSVLATNNTNMTPASFTYHVREHFEGGNQYDIVAPVSDDTEIQDIRSLIIPGSIRPMYDDDDDDDYCSVNIPSVSTQYIVQNLTELFCNVTITTGTPVSFAFISGTALPQDSDWVSGTVIQQGSQYLGEVLVGPSGHVLAAGYYRIWIQLTSSPQLIVKPAGFLNIYS